MGLNLAKISLGRKLDRLAVELVLVKNREQQQPVLYLSE